MPALRRRPAKRAPSPPSPSLFDSPVSFVADEGSEGRVAFGRSWAPAEDEALREAVATYGARWKTIAEALRPLNTGRSMAMCRNRWSRIRAGATMKSKNLCKRCGQLKRGHTCTAPGAIPLPLVDTDALLREGPPAPTIAKPKPLRLSSRVTSRAPPSPLELLVGGTLAGPESPPVLLAGGTLPAHSLAPPAAPGAFQIDVDDFYRHAAREARHEVFEDIANHAAATAAAAHLPSSGSLFAPVGAPARRPPPLAEQEAPLAQPTPHHPTPAERDAERIVDELATIGRAAAAEQRRLDLLGGASPLALIAASSRGSDATDARDTPRTHNPPPESASRRAACDGESRWGEITPELPAGATTPAPPAAANTAALGRYHVTPVTSEHGSAAASAAATVVRTSVLTCAASSSSARAGAEAAAWAASDREPPPLAVTSSWAVRVKPPTRHDSEHSSDTDVAMADADADATPADAEAKSAAAAADAAAAAADAPAAVSTTAAPPPRLPFCGVAHSFDLQSALTGPPLDDGSALPIPLEAIEACGVPTSTLESSSDSGSSSSKGSGAHAMALPARAHPGSPAPPLMPLPSWSRAPSFSFAELGGSFAKPTPRSEGGEPRDSARRLQLW